MKSSIFVAATGAMLAMAKPLNKRVMETEVVVEYYTVTVTGNVAAAEATSTVVPTSTVKPSTHIKQPTKIPTTTQIEAAATPSTTSQAYVVVTVTKDNTPEHEVTSAYSTAEEPEVTSTSKAEEQTTTTSEQAAATGDDFVTKALYHHNIHRSNHSAPALVWNQTIADYAATTAAKCVFAHDMEEGNGGYGQNIASFGQSSGVQALGDDGAIAMAATNMWYDGEFKAYAPYFGQDPDMNTFEAWGHLSQLVWSGTTAVGCHAQLCDAGTIFDFPSWFSVCNYYPPGNVGGGYATNVLVPQGQDTVTV
ncbi:CAP domain-containing protein [Xylariaceae sp. FL1019]|nr:CAP domain-containing protein [Xylariaceae sp. FL1019]